MQTGTTMRIVTNSSVLLAVCVLLAVLDVRTVWAAMCGLEWPGDGSIRRMLYWSNPLPMYDATYIFKVYPRKKMVPNNSPTGYYTTFFWGNNGNFTWDNGNCNSYYGAHPYPIPAPNGSGQWELSIYCNDFVTGQEVGWNRWYTQAVRVWRESPTVTHHEFYYDLPDTTKVIEYTITNDSNWGKTPPNPALVMGQAPDLCGPPPGRCNQSWGGYPGWEEFNGIIRGIQIYSNDLSLSDIQSEINAPKSTVAGQNSIWYLNLDPRPSDVTDKKGIGTSHNPAWDGITALAWTDDPTVPCGGSGTAPPPPPPSPPPLAPPTHLRVTQPRSASTPRVTLTWNDTVNTTQAGYRVQRRPNMEGSAYVTLVSTDATTRMYTDTATAGVVNQRVCYIVEAFRNAPGDVSSPSNEVCIRVQNR
jgi:hypothetical protein